MPEELPVTSAKFLDKFIECAYDLAPMPKRVKILTKLWLIYFLVTIAGLGIFVVLVPFFPSLALARCSRRFAHWPDRALQMGVILLFHVQPWLRSTVDLKVPKKTASDRGILFVSNHRSHLDVFFLLAGIAGIRVLARSNLFRIPFLGLMMRATRQIRVERGRLDAWVRAMREVAERLRKGERVHIFPEMTRCSQGFNSVQPFAAAPFLVAIQEDVSVVPIVFKNTDGVWPKGHLGLFFRKPIEVKSLQPIRARDFATAELLKSEVWKRIDYELRPV